MHFIDYIKSFEEVGCKFLCEPLKYSYLFVKLIRIIYVVYSEEINYIWA